MSVRDEAQQSQKTMLEEPNSEPIYVIEWGHTVSKKPVAAQDDTSTPVTYSLASHGCEPDDAIVRKLKSNITPSMH